jgi:hypothetical protein
MGLIMIVCCTVSFDGTTNASIRLNVNVKAIQSVRRRNSQGSRHRQNLRCHGCVRGSELKRDNVIRVNTLKCAKS